MIFRKGETYDSMEMSTKDVGLKTFETKTDIYTILVDYTFLIKTANHILGIKNL